MESCDFIRRRMAELTDELLLAAPRLPASWDEQELVTWIAETTMHDAARRSTILQYPYCARAQAYRDALVTHDLD